MVRCPADSDIQQSKLQKDAQQRLQNSDNNIGGDSVLWWMLYDDNWNVDIFNEQLNQYLNLGENHHYEKVVVTLGLDPIYTMPNIPGDTSFIQDNCTMTPLGYKRFDRKLREQAFEETNQLLEKVYIKIIEEIKVGSETRKC